MYWWSEFERTLQSCLYIDGTELILKLTVIVEIIFGIVMWFVVNGSDELNLTLILILCDGQLFNCICLMVFYSCEKILTSRQSVIFFPILTYFCYWFGCNEAERRFYCKKRPLNRLTQYNSWMKIFSADWIFLHIKLIEKYCVWFFR